MPLEHGHLTDETPRREPARHLEPRLLSSYRHIGDIAEDGIDSVFLACSDALRQALQCDALSLNDDLAAWHSLRESETRQSLVIQQYCPLDSRRRQTLLQWQMQLPWGCATLLELRIPGAAAISDHQLALISANLRLLAQSLATGQALDQARKLADTDSLTGLLNRRGFRQASRGLLDRTRRASLLIMDVDRFKQINDALGHAMGDTYLRGIAGRLIELMPQDAILARMGGDEFAMLIPSGAAGAERLAAEVHKSLQRPLRLTGEAVRPRMTIGICSLPEHVSSLHELLRCADLAMFDAKRSTRRSQTYSQECHRCSSATLRIESRLEAALADNRMQLAVQPIVCLKTGRTAEVEVLLRWNDPELGAVSPAEFIPLAESIGLINELDHYVVQKALQETRHLQEAIAINVSAPTLYDPGFADFVLHGLQQAGRPPATLTIEITERVLADAPRAADALLRLTRKGVRIAVDDFGAGYSSLGLLASLPLSRLKVDKSFMIGSHRNPRYLEVTMGVLKLSAALGLESLVEGLEDPADIPWLQQAGCDFAQGFGLARPRPVDRYLQGIAYGSLLSDKP